MTDDRPDQTEPLDDEFHSTLEIDDSSGWRVFIVPGVLLLFLLGAILFIIISQSDPTPDPRVAERLREKEAAKSQPAPRSDQPVAATPVNQATTAVPLFQNEQ